MTVKELRDILLQYPDDMQVIVYYEGITQNIEPDEIYVMGINEVYKEKVLIIHV